MVGAARLDRLRLKGSSRGQPLMGLDDAMVHGEKTGARHRRDRSVIRHYILVIFNLANVS